MIEEEKRTGNGEGHGELEDSVEGKADTEGTGSREAGAVETGAGGDKGNEDLLRAEDPVADDVANLLQENERLKMEVRENIDKALRAGAELDNVRKRTARDIENAHKYALERFINELLPVIDSMELGINASQAAEDIESLWEGMDLTLKKLFDCLDKFGVKTIDPVGEKFDPEWHEAVSMQEFEGSDSGLVVTVMQKGYQLNGRLVRPAMVVVAK